MSRTGFGDTIRFPAGGASVSSERHSGRRSGAVDHRITDTDSAVSVRNGDTDTDPDAHSSGHPDTGVHECDLLRPFSSPRAPDLSGHADSKTGRDGDAHPNADSHADDNPDRDTDARADENPDRYADSDVDSDTSADTYADTDADSHGDADSAREFVDLGRTSIRLRRRPCRHDLGQDVRRSEHGERYSA